MPVAQQYLLKVNKAGYHFNIMICNGISQPSEQGVAGYWR